MNHIYAAQSTPKVTKSFCQNQMTRIFQQRTLDQNTISRHRKFYSRGPADPVGVTFPRRLFRNNYPSWHVYFQTKGVIKSLSTSLPHGAFQKPEGTSQVRAMSWWNQVSLLTPKLATSCLCPAQRTSRIYEQLLPGGR